MSAIDWSAVNVLVLEHFIASKTPPRTLWDAILISAARCRLADLRRHYHAEGSQP